MMEYPLELSFKIFSIGPRIRVTDASGQMVAYVRQQALRLRERVNVFADEDQNQPLYNIEANRIMDFNASYAITTPDGAALGSVGRRGMRSIWRATYDIVDPAGGTIGSIHEEDPWVKAIDGLVGSIPVAGMATSYLFHPAYLVDLHGTTRLRLQKQPAFFETKFRLEQHERISEQEENLLLPSIMMMLLLERERG